MGKCCVCGFCTHFFYFSWRYKAISTNNTKDLPINEEIKAAEVRVIGAENEQVGIMKIDDARNYAYNHGVDLVLIVPNATPPVCRAIDYGKFCFERDKREKEAKKKQVIVKVKEIQLSCRIEQHDFETRINHAKRFLAEGNKVKAVVRFKGREMSHMELGREVIEKFCDALAECGSAEKKPMLEGRFMHVIISPLKPEKK
jgi:translation initiation factor IF-3